MSIYGGVKLIEFSFSPEKTIPTFPRWNWTSLHNSTYESSVNDNYYDHEIASG